MLKQNQNKITSGSKQRIFIDAGVEYIHIKNYILNDNGNYYPDRDITIQDNDEISKLFESNGIYDMIGDTDQVYLTGKVSEITRKVLGKGECIIPSAAIWSSAKYYLTKDENKNINTLGIVDLSASGYMIICIDKNENIIEDALIVNPRCGAGSGVNLSRILQKLDIKKDEVDNMLADYLGVPGSEKRQSIPVRTDRCGVFSSSATISDKNQGIPIEHALAVTMRSEVKKPCNKVPANIDKIYLTGGVFRWRYTRDCAEDFLRGIGVKEIVYDNGQSMILDGMNYLVNSLSGKIRKQSEKKLRRSDRLVSLPTFKELKNKYESLNLYERIEDQNITPAADNDFSILPVNLAMDIGSTMAKMIVTDAVTGSLLFKNSYNNHGDTIQTIKHIFNDFIRDNIKSLRIQNIGLTGSGRYQVQKALKEIYPHLSDRIFVLVENYAHARGALWYVKDHIEKLKAHGITKINEKFCMLVDIGGEDTKVSVISLEMDELFDNAMNIKCSAGTGSLMDTLKALFGIENISDAYSRAFDADRAFRINATCAVFLMENARKMQAAGYHKGEILASCTYAIVENMARTLWDQVDFPQNTVTLLHGQTMLSEPLPLAVTHRIQEYTGSDTYCIVPPLPGHRACIGLIKSIQDKGLPVIDEYCNLEDFINRKFEKKIFTCVGVACGDKNARCSRTLLTSEGKDGKLKLKLGGCTAVNELEAVKDSKGKGKILDVPDAYRDIWNFIDSCMPKNEAKNRLVIPRSFAVSEQAFFLGKIFEKIGIPVHIDNVREKDIMEGQPLFPLDTCAPNIGATGQFLRLAREEKGIILLPQIDFLPSDGMSLGRTCTTNQGGVLIAMHFAEERYPDARFKVFNLSLDKDDPVYLADQMYNMLSPVFKDYNIIISRQEFIDAITYAHKENTKLKEEVAERSAEYIQYAIDNKLNISIITGREYILNPGIYDSHAGKLLRDKGVLALPSYVFDTFLDKQFGYMYWRNPHDILSKVNALARKELHLLLKNRRLQGLIKKIETGITDSLISVVTISTFRCGPDTVMLPMLNEITKDFPTLLIQSDAMIAELAHLENRVNTHLNQLEKQLHNEIRLEDAEKFEIALMSEFNLDTLNSRTDVIYFPTLDDNRIITSVFKAMGIMVIDNFNDDTYDLEEKAKDGRKYMGDMVCVPMAAVFSDMLHSIDHFLTHKKTDDPLFRDRKRIILFMHGGDGPCRLGQYVDMYKLAFFRLFGKPLPISGGESNTGQPPIRLLTNISSSLLGKEDYTAKVEKWVGFQAYQEIILQGVFHSAYLMAASLCKNHEEFDEMRHDYIMLKEKIYHMIANDVKPGKTANFIVDTISKIFPKLAGPAQYFGYGIYNSNGFRKLLKKFSKKWITKRKKNLDPGSRVRIHVDGELYMRVAQIIEIMKASIDTLGFESFMISYTPIWCFFENILEARILVANKDIDMVKEKIKNSGDPGQTADLEQIIMDREIIKKNTEKTISNFRNILAKPLYRAAGLELPHPMKKIFSAAKAVIPTYKPFGELVPYVGETILNLRDGVNIIFNVLPEGCMVSSMGQTLSPKIMQESGNTNARIQNLSSTEGEIEEEVLQLALLRILGPEKFYRESR